MSPAHNNNCYSLYLVSINGNLLKYKICINLQTNSKSYNWNIKKKKKKTYLDGRYATNIISHVIFYGAFNDIIM